MPAYAIFEREYRDRANGPKEIEAYRIWPETVAKYGGRAIIRTGKIETL